MKKDRCGLFFVSFKLTVRSEFYKIILIFLNYEMI